MKITESIYTNKREFFLNLLEIHQSKIDSTQRDKQITELLKVLIQETK